MKKIIIFATFSLLLLALIASCRKDNLEPGTYPAPIDYTVLPPATQTGANTFGCLVDGEVWVPRVPLLAVTYRDIEATVWEKDLSGSGLILSNLVDGNQRIDNELVITFGNTNFAKGSYCEDALYARFRDNEGEYFSTKYHLLSDNCINITHFDTLNNIISGTFNLVLYRDSVNLNDKIEITDGRFDLKYSPQ